MQSFLRYLCPVITCVLLVGCIPMGDGVALLKGKIEDKQGHPLNGCSLTLNNLEEDSPSFPRDVESAFFVDVVIDPRPHDYVLIVRCEGRPDWRSPVYRFGGLTYSSTALDLGIIVMD